MCRRAQKVGLMFLGAEINFSYYNFYFGGGCYIQNLDLNALE